jgi:hypothetical protein
VLQRETGLLLAKVADGVHCGAMQLQAVDLVLELRRLGWTVCHFVPKHRQAIGDDPKWRHQLQLRNLLVVLDRGPPERELPGDRRRSAACVRVWPSLPTAP